MNPNNVRQFSRLRKSIDWSQRQFDFPRKERIAAVKQFVGYHHCEDGATLRVPVPLIALAVLIYVRMLAPRAPRVLITTKESGLRPTAANLELAVNQIPPEVKLGATLRRMVTEAIFSPWGIVKIGLHTVGKALGHDYGESFVDLVTLDDYFVDMAAKSADQIDYEGNDYWLDYEEFMESDAFKRKDGLKADEYTLIGPAGEDRAESMTADSSPETAKDKLWLRDVWLPDEGLLLTYGVKSERLHRVVDWDGPERGPYPKLCFSEVPGNTVPLPPVAIWRDLHELANSLFRKLGNEAEAFKRVLGFPGGNDESVEGFKKAKDGEGIAYNGGRPEKLEAGGVDPKTLAFDMQVRDLFSYFAGNLDSLGGLAPLTETVGQDKLIGEAASAQLRDMADCVVETSGEIFTALAYYEWHDPIKRRKLEKPIPGTSLSVVINWGRESKQGEFSQYDLAIDVYSLQDNSPSTKLQKLGLIMTQYVFPMAPLIEQAGGTIDVQRILEDIGKYADMPEVADYVTFMEPMQQPGWKSSSNAPAHTTREYVRKGQPGQSRQGASAAMQQLLMGGGVQDSEMQGASGGAV